MPPLLDAHVGDNHDAFAVNMVDHEIDCSQTCVLWKRRLRVGKEGTRRMRWNEVGGVELCGPKVWTTGPSDKSSMAPSIARKRGVCIMQVIVDPRERASSYTTHYQLHYTGPSVMRYTSICAGPNGTQISRSYIPLLLILIPRHHSNPDHLAAQLAALREAVPGVPEQHDLRARGRGR